MFLQKLKVFFLLIFLTIAPKQLSAEKCRTSFDFIDANQGTLNQIEDSIFRRGLGDTDRSKRRTALCGLVCFVNVQQALFRYLNLELPNEIDELASLVNVLVPRLRWSVERIRNRGLWPYQLRRLIEERFNELGISANVTMKGVRAEHRTQDTAPKQFFVSEKDLLSVTKPGTALILNYKFFDSNLDPKDADITSFRNTNRGYLGAHYVVLSGIKKLPNGDFEVIINDPLFGGISARMSLFKPQNYRHKLYRLDELGDHSLAHRLYPSFIDNPGISEGDKRMLIKREAREVFKVVTAIIIVQVDP